MNYMKASDVKDTLCSLATARQAEILSRFFKTQKGSYGEGDRFLGVRVPQTRMVAKEALDLPMPEIQLLLDDPIHEVRLCGFLILVLQYSKTKGPTDQEKIVRFYLKNTHRANNWDLVDLSAPKILGYWLRDKERDILYKLAASENLWEQRIAMVSNWTLIRAGFFEDTFELAKILMDHPHDLIRKAVGWMLREVGKKDRNELIRFLDQYASSLSRTSLRYAIEHFPPDLRRYYMVRE